MVVVVVVVGGWVGGGGGGVDGSSSTHTHTHTHTQAGFDSQHYTIEHALHRVHACVWGETETVTETVTETERGGPASPAVPASRLPARLAGPGSRASAASPTDKGGEAAGGL